MKNKKKLTKKETEILKEEIKQFLLENPDFVHLLQERPEGFMFDPGQKPIKRKKATRWQPNAWWQNIKRAAEGLYDTTVDDKTINPVGSKVVMPVKRLSGDSKKSASEKMMGTKIPFMPFYGDPAEVQNKEEYERETEGHLDNFELAMAAIGVMSFGIGMGGSVAGRVGASVYKSAVEKGIAKEVAKQMQEAVKRAVIKAAKNAAKEAAKQGLKRKATEKAVKTAVEKAVKDTVAKRAFADATKQTIIKTATKQMPKHMGSWLGRGAAKMIEWNPLSIALKHGLTKMGMSAAAAEFAGLAATLLVEGWGVVELFFCNAPKIETRDGKGFRIYDDFFKHIDPFNWLLLAFERAVPGGNLGGFEGFLEKDAMFGGTLPDIEKDKSGKLRAPKHKEHGKYKMFMSESDRKAYWALRGDIEERATELQKMTNADEICKEAARKYGELLERTYEYQKMMSNHYRQKGEEFDRKKQRAQIQKRKARTPFGGQAPLPPCKPGTDKGPNGEPCIRLCKQDPFSDNLAMVDAWDVGVEECPKITLPQPAGQDSTNPEDKFNKSKKTKKMIRLRKSVNKLNPTPEEE